MQNLSGTERVDTPRGAPLPDQVIGTGRQELSALVSSANLSEPTHRVHPHHLRCTPWLTIPNGYESSSDRPASDGRAHLRRAHAAQKSAAPKPKTDKEIA